MKKYKSFLWLLVAIIAFSACNNNEDYSEPPVEGEPVLTLKSQISSAMFGDSLSFAVNATDAKFPLSTLKAQLFFGENKVSETVIRTKTNGDYSGKIFIPYLANIPNGSATLKLVLQNTHFAVTEQEVSVQLVRPDYDQLTLVTADGKEYSMARTGLYQYKVTGDFPQKVKAYIKTPKASAQGNVITFGWGNGAITQGTVSPITFSNATAGTYDITFNTMTYVGSPFIKLLFGGTEMTMVDDNNYKVEKDLTTGQLLEVSGFSNFDQWWIDSDFFSKDASGKLKFLPLSGKYRITANFKYNYFIVERMTGNNLATLADDLSGAVWVIGTDIGKPSLANEVGWNTDKALCMAAIAPGKYQITVVAGKGTAGNVNPDGINFKFFHQKGWGGEFGEGTITSNSTDIVVIAGGGNLALATGKKLTAGKTYLFTLDVTGGKKAAVLTVTEK
ncbi:DUF5125 domain-containing protein [Bacteroides sedimenti]|uniref:DUF5125 domain-containing protein n=1 Tax=Bacteroides sedimenti TaxID=2136147 RepID=A0ABN6Z7G8_9BACE